MPDYQLAFLGRNGSKMSISLIWSILVAVMFTILQ